MKMFRDLFLIAMIACGAVGGSQLPQLVQEYEQRLGGARDEAQAAHRQDVAEAKAFGLTLEGFAERYRASEDQAVQAGAERMLQRRDRAERLDEAYAALGAAPYLLRPWVAFTHLETGIAEATWSSFRPTLTLDIRFGIAGILAGWILHALLALLWRALFRRPPKEKNRFRRA
ncbi:DUF2937 family protein [Nisaea acidiphila]|uniref:DUF2937 family protein n=1 Tax=Nisaea acidiphila TaxID=1862145 RepID=A0A9J7AM89_9PROT|nr:DUF2937 family protein [Nisaea acidiphila]UUX48270.1 DUF2937 family protein [Nisaea acidiphila]